MSPVALRHATRILPDLALLDAVSPKNNGLEVCRQLKQGAALPGELAESLLFGHVKGAFTGAVADQKGCFEMGRQASAIPRPLTASR